MNLHAARTWLFVPGDRPDRFAKAEASGADVVIADLEDGVDPAHRPKARQHVASWLHSPPPAGSAAQVVRAVRVNAPGTADHDDDWVALRDAPRPDVVVIPKAESSEVIGNVAAAWRCALMAGIETVRGVLGAAEVLAVPGVATCYFGAEDYIADLGGVRTPDGAEVLTARSLVAMHARVNGVSAIDQIVADFGDDGRLVNDSTVGRNLGYAGKLCIHPRQCSVIANVYSNDDDVAWARRVLAAASDHGSGAFQLDGQMIDAPLIAQAQRLAASRQEGTA